MVSADSEGEAKEEDHVLKSGERSEGQRLLLVVCNKYTQIKVARRCGVSQTIVSQWISGARKPVYENRKELFERYGIGLDTWEQPAQKPQPKPQVTNG